MTEAHDWREYPPNNKKKMKISFARLHIGRGNSNNRHGAVTAADPPRYANKHTAMWYACEI